MAKVGRNERCSCGSGLKVKRCCGTHAAVERLERQEEAILEAFTLATHFPRLRPDGPEISVWADGVAERRPTRDLLAEGRDVLGEAEVDRILADTKRHSRQAWPSLCEDLGEEVAVGALLVGAVFAAVVERRPPHAEVLQLLEDDEPEDHCETLALGLEPGNLWSIVESHETDMALSRIDQHLDDDVYESLWTATLEAEAERQATQWHRERIATLVGRLRSHLPVDGQPTASAALLAACDAFDADDGLRTRLIAMLLGDSLDRIQFAQLDAGLAAAA